MGDKVAVNLEDFTVSALKKLSWKKYREPVEDEAYEINISNIQVYQSEWFVFRRLWENSGKPSVANPMHLAAIYADNIQCYKDRFGGGEPKKDIRISILEGTLKQAEELIEKAKKKKAK